MFVGGAKGIDVGNYRPKSGRYSLRLLPVLVYLSPRKIFPTQLNSLDVVNCFCICLRTTFIIARALIPDACNDNAFNVYKHIYSASFETYLHRKAHLRAQTRRERRD